VTLLPYYGADRKTNPHIVRGKAKRGTCSFFGSGTAYVVCKGWSRRPLAAGSGSRPAIAR
jgi:hypothetical protein